MHGGRAPRDRDDHRGPGQRSPAKSIDRRFIARIGSQQTERLRRYDLRPLVLGLFSETYTTNINLAPVNPVSGEGLRSIW